MLNALSLSPQMRDALVASSSFLDLLQYTPVCIQTIFLESKPGLNAPDVSYQG